jgi:cell wall-associated NlpC family hydrolase
MTAIPVPASSATRLAAGTLTAFAGGVLALILLIAALARPTAPPSATSTVNTTNIPAAYVPWVLAAGSLCAAIPPSVIAAQDQVESGWNPRIVSSAGAEGIAQFLPATFPQWGSGSPFNPRDAIMAQGRYDCSLAALAQQLLDKGEATGTATDLALAAYNAGPGAVEAAHGIPAVAVSYVHQIDTLAATKYAASTDTRGEIAVQAAESALGTPYRFGGSCTNPHSTDPRGWCDCSSLVQMAWRAAGVALPRTTYQQVHTGAPVASISDLQPGDLIFIPGSDGTSSNPGHVGIYAGNGWLVNAPQTGQDVQFARVSDWQGQIVAMRRP